MHESLTLSSSGVCCRCSSEALISPILVMVALVLGGSACSGSGGVVNRIGVDGGTTPAASGGGTSVAGSSTSTGSGGAVVVGGTTISGGATAGGSGGQSRGGDSLAGGKAGGTTSNTSIGNAGTGGTSANGGTATGGVSKATGTNSSAGTSASGGQVLSGGSNSAGGSKATGGASASVSGGRAGTTGGGSNAGGTTGSAGGTTSTGSTSTSPVSSSIDGPVGFAAISAFGLDTTTGGKGGKVVTASTFDELHEYMDSDETLIILVSGTIDLGGMTPLRSNKTLIGQKGARLINGGFEIYKRQNIIIRNIVFADGTDDTMKINQNTHHVWVDHCDFTNAEDGLFDITRQTSNITVSYNHFYKHSKTMLIGHSDSQTDDTGFLKTTIHHNWFDGTEQRHPRVRFGEVHVFNNYFLNNGLYGVASTMEADVVMEGNVFEGVAYPSYVGYQESGPGDLVERNNVYVSSGTPQIRGTAFDPSTYYKVTLDDPNTIAAKVKAQAGAGVLDPEAILAASR